MRKAESVGNPQQREDKLHAGLLVFNELLRIANVEAEVTLKHYTCFTLFQVNSEKV